MLTPEVDALDKERAAVGHRWLAELDQRPVALGVPPGACLPGGGKLEHHEPGVAADLEGSLEDLDDRAAQRDAAAVDRVGRCGGPSVAPEGRLVADVHK